MQRRGGEKKKKKREIRSFSGDNVGVPGVGISAIMPAVELA
jgi:hypothetical protein